MNSFIKKLLQYFLLLAIIALGFFLRIYNINWDQNFHLHPDERFLTMVGNAMKMPETLSDYLNPTTSLMNPANIGFQFYVYGTFPVVMNKILAVNFDRDTYNLFTLQGRALSAFFDTLTIIFVYATTFFLRKKYNWHSVLPYLAAFLYAIAVLPIQLSHFFTTDTFVNFFVFSSFYFALLFSEKKSWEYAAVSAILMGCAIGSKISAVFIMPLIIFLLAAGIFGHHRNVLKWKYLLQFVGICLLFGILCYFITRLTDPYFFQTNSFFDPRINHILYTSLQTLKAFDIKNTYFPPSIQWINKVPIIFSLTNIAVYGIGLPYFLLMIVGAVFYIRLKKFRFFSIYLWCMIFFIYQATQFTQPMRYFLSLYPFLAILCSLGLVYIYQKYNVFITIVLLYITLIWPIAFMSIYMHTNTRVLASKWIYQHIPTNSLLLGEYWDDGLPLPIETTYGKVFRSDQMHSFDPDTTQKWIITDDLLQNGDYLILSSNRGWGSIPTVPNEYPLMKKFYEDLFAGKLYYKEVASFTSYPSLDYLGLPITFNDSKADESFSVYDHPEVHIFKNMRK